MAYDKNKIDEQAEREAMALKQQGQNVNQQHKRRKYSKEYNVVLFDKLFKS